MLAMGSYLDQLTPETMLARKRSTSSEEGPGQDQSYRRPRQHHLHLPPSLECSSDQQIFLPSALPSVQEKEGPTSITSWQLTSRSPYTRPAPIRTDGSVSSSDTLNNPSSSRRHDTFAHERRFSDASALLSASSAYTSPNDPFSAGFLSDASYLRSPDQKDFPSTYAKLPASHTQDVYATNRQDEMDTANSPLLSSRARAGSNSSNMPIDLSKLDLKLTLGVEGKPYSYAQLITYAIAHAPGGKLTLSEIYDWCIENFPYFQKQTNAGWKNSVRHNLSLNKTFVKVPRPVHEPGKGAYWALDGQSLTKGPVTTSQSRNRQRSQSAVEPLTRPCQTSKVAVAGRPRAGSGVSGSELSSVRSRYQPSSLSSVLSQDYADSLFYPQSCAVPSMLPYSPVIPSIQATIESQPRGYLQSCYPDFPVGMASQYRDGTIHGSQSPELSTLSSARMQACHSIHSNPADFMAENTFPDCDTTHHQLAGTMSTPIVLPRGYEPLSHPSQWTLPEQMNIARYYSDPEDDCTMQYN